MVELAKNGCNDRAGAVRVLETLFLENTPLAGARLIATEVPSRTRTPQPEPWREGGVAKDAGAHLEGGSHAG
jgi:hypothetical protein